MKEKWEFPYAADVLAEAAKIKLDHHTSRLAWWKEKYDEKFNEIKTKGLSVQESVASNNVFYSASNSYQQPIIAIDQTLTNEFNECKNKVNEHKHKVNEYNAWNQVLSAQGKSVYNLLHSDWLFFFGK